MNEFEKGAMIGRCIAVFVMICLVGMAVVALTGCAVGEKMAESLAGKNVSGSGLIADNRIGLDPETQTPVLKSFVVSGDFQTIKSDTNYVNYREEESGAWFNAENKTRKKSLTITANNAADFASALRFALDQIENDTAAGDAKE